jgi:hypothetical protein
MILIFSEHVHCSGLKNLKSNRKNCFESQNLVLRTKKGSLVSLVLSVFNITKLVVLLRLELVVLHNPYLESLDLFATAF